MNKNVSRGRIWKQNREEVIERDGGRCVVCGFDRAEHRETYGRDLEVHHKTPMHTIVLDGESYEELAHDKRNLITLCQGCHKRAESEGWAGALGIVPKSKTRSRYMREKPDGSTDTEFIGELLDAYELVHSDEQNIVEPRIEANVEINIDDLADDIAEAMADKYVGIDESLLAGKIAHDVEGRMRGWSR